MKDLTAIFIPQGQRTTEEIRELASRFGDVWLRIAPLEKLGLVQLEILDGARGLPTEDPELVGGLSKGGRATFVHINHSAPQALVHAFKDGEAEEGWMGAPGPDFEKRLVEAVGHTLEELHAGDDGSRLGIGAAGSKTIALVRGRVLEVPPGTPTGLNSFAFHDRAHEVGEGTRVAPFAFDLESARVKFSSPARELAAHLSEGLTGPLAGARPEVVQALVEIGDRPLTPEDPIAQRALELCALDHAYVFGGGDRQYYLDHRVLPMFQLSTGAPQFDPEELDELEDSDSILEAMVDVLPYAAPPGGEGSIISNFAPDELLPLAWWAEGQPEYTGTIFRLRPERILKLVRTFEGPALNEHIEKFERAWYQASRNAQPQGDAFETWRRVKAEEGQADVQRFLLGWTELRIVLELAAANRLAVGLIFYE